MFNPKVKFKFPWRPYQEQILREFDKHIIDKHLHFVAPPGAGKTVLGLELIRRLNEPTLVLAPNIGIRDQWKERFVETFVEANEAKVWEELISHDIDSGSNFIIATYQAFYSKSKSPELLKESLKHIKVVALDEAHHLQNSWMKALDAFKQSQELVTISLTATPPYDASYEEWSAYMKINGPIDAEISLVDLVKSGSLCPHQDYIYHLEPTEEDIKKVIEFKALADTEKEKLFNSFDFVEYYTSQPWVVDPLANEYWIFKNFDLYLYTVSFLAQKGLLKNQSSHSKLLEMEISKIPKGPSKDDESFIKYYLKNSELGEGLRNRYLRLGLMIGPHLKFDINSVRNSVLKKSISRLVAIKTLVEKEASHLKSDLRMLILTSRIQDELIKNTKQYKVLPNQVAVFPIFEYLRRNVQFPDFTLKLGVLTGSYCVIPKRALLRLEFIEDHFNWSDYPYDDQFVISRTPKKGVAVITRLIECGEIEVIVGTQSLLGEGWDAPAINTLVLASEISSYVSTNQMRGRAIRKDVKNLNKAAHIWHLGFYPKKKFNHFIGPYNSLDKMGIITGTQRFLKDNEHVDKWVAQREDLPGHWQACIKNGKTQVNSIMMPPEEKELRSISLSAFNKANKKQARVVWDSLRELKLVVSVDSEFELVCKRVSKSQTKVFLKGVSSQDEAIFLKCLEQMFYSNYPTSFMILRSQSWWSEMFFNPRAYLPKIMAVPEVLAKNRASVEVFYKHFERHISKGKILSTKESVGRRELIRNLYKNKMNPEMQHVRELSWD